MAGNIDTRIVEMEFDNTRFEKGAKETLNTIDKLNSGVDKMGDWSGDAIGVGLVKSLSGVNEGLEKCSQSMSAFEQFSLGVFTRLGQKVTDLGLQISNELFVAQKKAGFQEYEMELGSVQTINASTGKSFEEIYGYLAELNKYADDTIYSFSDMTRNIGKFTNAGVELETAVKAIQGISNEAAVSGANAEEAGRAMYNFAQALSSGAVRLIDWKSIENANMATVEFKEELIKTALELGTIQQEGDKFVSTTTDLSGKISGAFSATTGFNDSLAHQWMTTEVLTKTLAKYSDATTEIGKKAFAAAQDVKSFSQLISTLKEAIGSGWAESFRIVIGEFEDAKKLWTGVSNTLGGVVDAFSNLRNHALRYWKQEGGRTKLLNSLIRLWKIFSERLSIIGTSFKANFPIMNKTGHVLMNLTNKFAKFTKNLKNGFLGNQDALDNFRQGADRVFHGLKALMKTVRDISIALKTVFLTVIRAIAEEIGDITPLPFIFEQISLKIFRAAKAFKAWITDSKRLAYIATIAKGLYSVFKLVVEVVRQVASAFKPTLKEVDAGEPIFLQLIARIAELIIKFTEFLARTKFIEKGLTKIINIFKSFKPIAEGVKESFSFFKDGSILKGLSSIGNGFKNFFKNIFSGFSLFKKSGNVTKDATNEIQESSVGFAGEVQGSFLSLFNSLKTLFIKIKNVASNGIKSVASAISSMFTASGEATTKAEKEAEKPVNGLTYLTQQLWNGFNYLLDMMAKIGKRIGEEISKMFGGFSGSMKTAKKDTEQVGEQSKSWIQTVIDGLKDALKKIKDGINLTEITSTIGEGLKAVWIGLTEDPLLTALVAGWLQMIGIVKQFISPVKSFSDAIDNLSTNAGKVLKSTSGLLDGIKGSVDAWKKQKTADMFVEIAGALLLVAISIGIITLAFSKDGAAATAGLGAAIGLLLEMSTIVKGLAEAFPNPVHINQATTSMVQMAGALLVMAMAISMMTKAGKGNTGGLVVSVMAMALLMGMMSEVIQSLVKATPNPKMLKSASEAMVKMGAALYIVSKAVATMAEVGKDGNTKSLIISVLGLVLILGMLMEVTIALAKAANGMDKSSRKNAKNISSLVTLMTDIAVVAIILTKAVTMLGSLKADELVRGLVGIAVVLGMLYGFTIALSKVKVDAKAITQSISLIASLSMVVMYFSSVVKMFASMKLEELKTGLIGLAVTTGVLVAFLIVMSKTSKDLHPAKMSAAASSLVTASIAILLLSSAIKNLAGLSIDDLGPGVAMLGALLLIIFGVLIAVSKLGGAKDAPAIASSIVMMAFALSILEKVLEKLQKIEFNKVKGGLLALGLLLAGIVVLGYFATPLKALGVALLAFGAALLFVGKGVKLIAKGFNIFAKTIILLASSWSILEPVIDDIVQKLAASIPIMASAAVEGIKTFATKIKETAPLIGETVGTLIKETLKTLYGWIPEFIQEMLPIIVKTLKLLRDNAPKIFEYVFDILLVFLTKLEERMPELTDKLGNILYDFVIGVLDVVIEREPELLEKLYDFIISMINNLADFFSDEHVDTFIEAMNKFIDNVVDAVIKVINNYNSKIMEIGYRLVSGIIKGTLSRAKRVGKAVWRLLKGALNIGKHHLEEIKDIAKLWVDKMIEGIKSKIKDAKDGVKKLGKEVIKAFKKVLGIASPSKEFEELGEYIPLGAAKGIEATAKVAEDAVRDVGDSTIDEFKKTEENLPTLTPEVDGTVTYTPVIQMASAEDKLQSLEDSVNGQATIYTDKYTVASTSTDFSQNTQAAVSTTFSDDTYEMYQELKNAIEDLTEMLDGMVIVDEDSKILTEIRVSDRALATAVSPFLDKDYTTRSKKASNKTAQPKKYSSGKKILPVK